MSESFQFIFSSFWVFIGTLMLIGVSLNGLAPIFRALLRMPEPVSKFEESGNDEWEVIVCPNCNHKQIKGKRK